MADMSGMDPMGPGIGGPGGPIIFGPIAPGEQNYGTAANFQPVGADEKKSELEHAELNEIKTLSLSATERHAAKKKYNEYRLAYEITRRELVSKLKRAYEISETLEENKNSLDTSYDRDGLQKEYNELYTGTGKHDGINDLQAAINVQKDIITKNGKGLGYFVMPDEEFDFGENKDILTKSLVYDTDKKLNKRQRKQYRKNKKLSAKDRIIQIEDTEDEYDELNGKNWHDAKVTKVEMVVGTNLYKITYKNQTTGKEEFKYVTKDKYGKFYSVKAPVADTIDSLNYTFSEVNINDTLETTFIIPIDKNKQNTYENKEVMTNEGGNAMNNTNTPAAAVTPTSTNNEEQQMLTKEEINKLFGVSDKNKNEANKEKTNESKQSAPVTVDDIKNVVESSEPKKETPVVVPVATEPEKEEAKVTPVITPVVEEKSEDKEEPKDTADEINDAISNEVEGAKKEQKKVTERIAEKLTSLKGQLSKLKGLYTKLKDRNSKDAVDNNLEGAIDSTIEDIDKALDEPDTKENENTEVKENDSINEEISEAVEKAENEQAKANDAVKEETVEEAKEEKKEESKPQVADTKAEKKEKLSVSDEAINSFVEGIEAKETEEKPFELSSKDYGINDEAYNELKSEGYKPGTEEFANRSKEYGGHNLSEDAQNKYKETAVKKAKEEMKKAADLPDDIAASLAKQGYTAEDPRFNKFVEMYDKSGIKREASLSDSEKAVNAYVDSLEKGNEKEFSLSGKDYGINEDAYNELISQGYKPGTEEFASAAKPYGGHKLSEDTQNKASMKAMGFAEGVAAGLVASGIKASNPALKGNVEALNKASELASKINTTSANLRENQAQGQVRGQQALNSMLNVAPQNVNTNSGAKTR